MQAKNQYGLTSSIVAFNAIKVDENRGKAINVEDDIRDKERLNEFDEEFIELARSVYFTNDVRSVIKKEINIEYGSGFVEEKSYQKYE